MAVSYIIFPDKVKHKWNKETLDIHKKVIITYLASKGIKYSTRKKLFRLYDLYIDENNILQYYFTPIKIFIAGLVRDELDKVSTYIVHNNGRKKRKYNRKRKNSTDNG